MRPEKNIIKIIHGSTLYGTSTPASDVDYKEVFIPSARDILLQRVKSGRSNSPDKDPGAKNQPGDVDVQSFSVGKFLDMISGGDIIGCEILFAPNEFVLQKTDEFDFIRKHSDVFLTKNVMGYVGYCRKQANKYGIKGSRVAAVRGLVELLTPHFEKNSLEKVGSAWEEVIEYVKATEHCSIEMIESNGVEEEYISCCSKKVPRTFSFKEAYRIYKRQLDEYGHRALAAERNEGIDWKAMSHAVRVGEQAIELLNDRILKFPRHNCKELLSIKSGEVPYAKVAERLERILEEVMWAGENSTLPKEPRSEEIEDILLCLHHRQMTPG